MLKAQKVAECVVGDATGTILLSARNDQGAGGDGGGTRPDKRAGSFFLGDSASILSHFGSGRISGGTTAAVQALPSHACCRSSPTCCRSLLLAVDLVKPGTYLTLRNCKVDMFRGSMRLAVEKVSERAGWVGGRAGGCPRVWERIEGVWPDGGATMAPALCSRRPDPLVLRSGSACAALGMQWGKIEKAAGGERFEPKLDNNMSLVEYELVPVGGWVGGWVGGYFFWGGRRCWGPWAVCKRCAGAAAQHLQRSAVQLDRVLALAARTAARAC